MNKLHASFILARLALLAFSQATGVTASEEEAYLPSWQRDLQAATQYIPRARAINIYKVFCPAFKWRVGGCSPALGKAVQNVTLCAYVHQFRRSGGASIQRTQTAFRYKASRSGVQYGEVQVICKHNSNRCEVKNLNCFKTVSSCQTCSGSAKWICTGATPVCGCQRNSCQRNVTAASNCDCNTMVPLPWSANNTATIEFCQDDVEGAFGYRLPGSSSCLLAKLVVRLQPGQTYRLTLSNNATQSTNLHTHGLHISGDGNSDDVDRIVSPGKCLTYTWDIPADHMGGTHWMHSHSMDHGYTQVLGGALSMLIVEENNETLQDVPVESVAGINAWLNNELLLVASNTGSFQGNGKKNLVLDLVQGEWYRLRILTVDVYGNSWTVAMPTQCVWRSVAHDGVWRFAVPNAALPVGSNFRGTPSGRVDVALRCPTAGTYTIQASGSNTVATLRVRAGATTGATPFTASNTTWTPRRPYYLQDLSSSPVNHTMEIALSYNTINGVSYSESTPLGTLTYGSVEEWTLVNAEFHSYHGHVHHAQVQSCPGFDTGEFYDTIMPTDSFSPCVVRFRVADYSGKVVVHCHTIMHAEMGAMAWFNASEGGKISPSTDRDEFTCPA